MSVKRYNLGPAAQRLVGARSGHGRPSRARREGPAARPGGPPPGGRGSVCRPRPARALGRRGVRRTPPYTTSHQLHGGPADGRGLQLRRGRLLLIDAGPPRSSDPRHLFFTGKGGVGKTSLACSSAIALADLGRSGFSSSAPTPRRTSTRSSERAGGAGSRRRIPSVWLGGAEHRSRSGGARLSGAGRGP